MVSFSCQGLDLKVHCAESGKILLATVLKYFIKHWKALNVINEIDGSFVIQMASPKLEVPHILLCPRHC